VHASPLPAARVGRGDGRLLHRLRRQRAGARYLTMTATKQVQLDRLTFDVVGQRAGGFGKVWFLRRPKDAPFEVVYGNECVVKTFKAEEDEAQIEQELGNWVALRHPHIARLIKICRLDFELGGLMERMPGNLADYLQNRTLSEQQVKTVLLDILRGLEYAYREHGLVHLDLKPLNLLLISADSPHVQITDWGISRIASTSRAQTASLGSHDIEEKTQFDVGTPPYMAPERFSKSWSISPAADVFSLGIIAVELITGQLPSFNGHQHPVVLLRSREYFKRAKYMLRDTSGPLQSLVLTMLDPESKRRPQDYSALISTIERL
jgi:serine/threonine protein kinase